ncbi:unnamed protein product, partial [Tetraodon nigroviridis]
NLKLTESPVSSCVSLKSHQSKDGPPDLSGEAGPSHPKNRKESVLPHWDQSAPPGESSGDPSDRLLTDAGMKTGQ